MLARTETFRSSAGEAAFVETFVETFVANKNQKGAQVDPIDAGFVVVPAGDDRVLLDLITHSYGDADNGTVVSDTLDPAGAAATLSRIADFSSTGGATTAEIWRLLEAGMPAAGGYTLRADYGRVGGAEIFRQVIVLAGANQALTANGNNAANTTTTTVTVTRASGVFPVDSIVYAICSDSEESRIYTVTGDAIKILEDTSGWIGTNGHCFARGRLTAAKSPVSITFTVSSSVGRIAAAAVVVEPAVPLAAMEPITIQGDRLYSGGRRYFKTGHFLYSFAVGQLSALNYFADAIDSNERAQLRAQTVGHGWNSMDILLLNDGDAQFPRASPYTGSTIGGTFDTAKLATWRSLLEELIAQRIRPNLWMRSDESPLTDAMSVANFKAFMDRMVAEFDDLPVMWCVALECDEYWTQAQVDDYGAHLAAAATQPVAVHQLINAFHFMDGSWCQVGFLQTANSQTWPTHYDTVLAAKAAIGNKPLVHSEYQQNNPGGMNDDARRFALAGAFAGSAGFGTGGPEGLGRFMESLPDGMTPSRSGDILTLSGSGITAEANMATITFRLVP